MAFALRRRKRVKLSKGRRPLFVEKEFDGRAILVGLFDYTTCQRNDGSFYGTAPGNQCRKGTEVNSKDYEKIKEAQAAQDKVWKKMSGPEGAKLDAAARLELAESVTDVNITEKKYKEIEDAISKRKEEYAEKVRSGELTSQELDDLIENYKFQGDASEAPMMIVGIEGTPPPGTKDPKVHDEHLGEQLAIHNLKKEGKYESNDIDFVNSGTTIETIGRFTQSTADMMTKLSGEAVSPGETLYGTRVAAAELRTLKAPMEKDWPLGKRPGIANNPELAARVGTREAYEKRYGEAMAQNLKNRIQASVEGKGEHILLVTSKDDPNAAALRKEIQSYVNDPKVKGRTSSFVYETSKFDGTSGKADLDTFKGSRVPRVGTIHEISKPNGKKAYIYDLGLGVSSSAINSKGPEGLASVLVKERQKMQSQDYKPRSKSEADAIVQNREFARQRRIGKEPRWLANKNNVQNLTDTNVKRAAKFGGQSGKVAQQELVRRGLAKPSAPAPASTRARNTVSRPANNSNKTKAPQTPSNPPKTVADKRAAAKKAMMFQVEGMRARGMSDAAIRESLKRMYGSLANSI